MTSQTQTHADERAGAGANGRASANRGTMADAAARYRAYPPVDLPDRQWPARAIEKAPIWCSVDLRDGNQALIDPMGHERKARMFKLLLDMGFPEIELGFPSASQTDFDFCRWAIEEGGVPDEVSLQVLVQCRPELITRTFEALEGARRPIVHFYNSTSELQRRVVFRQDRAGIRRIAVDAAKMIRDMAEKAGGGFRFQYSPESFTGTELDFALEICNAVTEVIEPTPDDPIILNLPATVEMSTPNIHADQIEWMSRNLDRRDAVILSLHTHNDRGTGVAATELGLMAGADRVEGTLFGNGERTGNVDIVTLALNMMTQGVDPGLDVSDIEQVKEVYEYANQLRIPERHPYVGELVYTAFSGSHQDAINKGMDAIRVANDPHWEVPYLPIDPTDVGRTYEAIIRINSQSGKGGIAYVLKADYGLELPRGLQVELREVVQEITDREGRELPSSRIREEFDARYLDQPDARLAFVDHETRADPAATGRRAVVATIEDGGERREIEGRGTGPIDGFLDALNRHLGTSASVESYDQHAIGHGSDTSAISYVELMDGDRRSWGAGLDSNVVHSALKAVTAAANRLVTP